jgi:hypothetical protein
VTAKAVKGREPDSADTTKAALDEEWKKAVGVYRDACAKLRELRKRCRELNKKRPSPS